MAFNCTKCGACCKMIGSVISAVRARPQDQLSEQDKLFRDFPYPVDAAGVCTQYDSAVGCKVYADRPLICSVDRMYAQFYAALSRDEYDQLNTQMCGVLIDHLGMDPALKP